MNDATRTFRAVRDALLRHREDYAGAVAHFDWPRLERFNWALDWFDAMARSNDRTALCIVGGTPKPCTATFAQLSARSAQVANHLRSMGVQRGDPIMLMLGNEPALWETMLAAIKLGAPFIPCSVLLTPRDLAERVARSGAKHVVTGRAGPIASRARRERASAWAKATFRRAGSTTTPRVIFRKHSRPKVKPAPTIR
ncbi:MAG: AMP-binding protein [Rhodanobacteraceae bacterium]